MFLSFFSSLVACARVELFGVDLVRDCRTGDYVVIDINYCPGYYGVDDVFKKLLDMFVKRLQEK